MELADYQSDDCTLVRNGGFESLGSVFTHYPQQLVFALREQDIDKIQHNPSVSCVITTDTLVPKVPGYPGLISADNPKEIFYEIHASLSRQTGGAFERLENTIHSSSTIHPSATIASRGVRIGRNVEIGKNVVIHEQTIIDDGVIIRSGSVVGNTCTLKGKQDCIDMHPSGGVHIHRDVDIHANTIIDRAVFKGYTVIGRQTKVDNLVHIGPGVRIGERCLVVACANIGDCVVIGNDSWIGPNSTLAEQILIGNQAYITLGSHVSRDVGDNMLVKDKYVIDRQRFKKVIR
ncbi:transferase hexapeptide repeat containing protein [Methanoregula boonei 6A8]|uniref:Transferase hexapeptide repeat containing protein n=1 Tax=Methanoregula boonei (strain DSM 21154 / JCM 14090 / 6A8) TaxID=456442 RepID=A7I945_METB6|nr:UDP-3-O-(3-hydroxymyristoyl)glucosamine N-acyltransferase [Methanoregula boonei]ABS56256.1 transferase hexapeptide repeat containing protein [Methanoregula boonei 6A8]